MSNDSLPASPSGSTEDHTVAIVAYITIIGFIVALVLYGQPGKKNAFNAFHLRQTLGLALAWIAVYFALGILAVIPILNLVAIPLFPLVGLGFFVLWVIGLITAVNGQQKPVPLLGSKIQDMFKNAFV